MVKAVGARAGACIQHRYLIQRVQCHPAAELFAAAYARKYIVHSTYIPSAGGLIHHCKLMVDWFGIKASRLLEDPPLRC